MVNLITTIFGIAKRIIAVQIALIPFSIFVFQLHARDFIYTILALILPYRPVGRVIPKGQPGYAGLWPEYQPPAKEDSRSPCPGINALANHGILPRNGRGITYKQFSVAFTHAYNMAPTLAEQLTSSAYMVDQGRGYIDLHDLNALNVIQHDASFTRPDIAFCPDQGYPDPALVDHFLGRSTDGKKMSIEDMVYFSGLRRAECKASNGEFSLTYSFFHKFFGSGNAALMYSIFGGDVKDLTIWLKEERFPDGWEPKCRWSYGHSIVFAQKTTIEIEFNINEKQTLRPGDSFLKIKHT